MRVITLRPISSALAFFGILIFQLAGASPAAALAIEAIPAAARAKLAPEILPVLAAGDAEPVPVIVMMSDQVDLERLNAELTAAGIERRERPSRVIPVLKERAERSQAPLVVEIGRWQAAGAVTRVRSLWMVNALLVSGRPEVVVAIGERSDVAQVDLDQPIGIESVFADPSDRPARKGGDPFSPGQAEPGLRVVAAPALWGRGFTGAGILVMNLDSGVDGQHPSLGPRWLGNTAGVLASDAWFDPVQQSCSTPCDYDFHGTLTLSVVTGLNSETADTVGVSFGSKWIAGAVVGGSTGNVLAGFEWAAEAPGGSRGPADVLSLSIQDPSVGLPGDCGPNGIYWQVVDAFEAIGGAVTWAAGNEGPGPQTINYPKNRITTPVNMFTVGNISPHVPSFPIHSTSSRGPSRCDGLTPKPECVAPGTTIRVATPGGGYGTFTGTSLAGPHAAGVCALLMEAFPSVSGSEIKLALLATARDLGVAGDDNTYGMGLIDAGAAFDLLAATTATGDPGQASSSARITLSEAAPNPFHPETTLAIGLPGASRITVRVYNLKGQVVATLAESAERAAGRHELVWDGRTQAGERAPSGVYFFRLEVRSDESGPARTWLRKAVLVD